MEPNIPTYPTPQPSLPSNEPSGKRSRLPIVIISILAVIAIGVGVVAILPLIGNKDDKAQTSDEPRRVGVEEQKEFEKGTSAQFGYFKVTINDVKRNYKPEAEYLPVNEGYGLAVVNFTVENTDSTAHFISDIDLGLLVSDKVINSSFLRVDPAFMGASLEPGASVSGNLAFEIPPSATDLKFYYFTQQYNEDKQKMEKTEYTIPL